MSEPFIGEIRIFAGNFAPRGWAFCNGQLLSIAENASLFEILGTTYGGDGESTFALPDLQGRLPMHPGRGPGLTARRLGERGGVESVALSGEQLTSHSHVLVASGEDGDDRNPGGRFVGRGNAMFAAPGAAPTAAMNAAMLPATGGGGAHDNLQPYQAVRFIIALVGLIPSRD